MKKLALALLAATTLASSANATFYTEGHVFEGSWDHCVAAMMQEGGLSEIGASIHCWTNHTKYSGTW